VDVSDLESDIELDELIPTYLKIKGKLYEIDPSLVETGTRKQARGAKGKKTSATQPPQSPAARKLLSQLQRITSDSLFDEDEAELRWPAKRNQIAQDMANKRQEQIDQSPSPKPEQESAEIPVQSDVPKVDTAITVVDTSDVEDDADLLGGMFSAVPDVLEPGRPDEGAAISENVILRDFGKSSGLTPRRLLEEAVRSRFVDWGNA
jgi:ATP-dependent RNA helicase DHX29